MIHAASLDLPSRKLAWVMGPFCLVALAISGYLAWSAFQQTEVFGCSGGEVWDCGHVLQSEWAKWFGMPVSLPAIAMYSAVLIALAVCVVTSDSTNSTSRRLAWAVVTVGGLSAGIAAIWFISLQVFVLKKLCIYCMCAHCCGILLSAIILWRRPLGRNMTSALSGISVLGACALIAGQWLTPPQQTYAVERYDTVDFTSEDDSVFAIDGVQENTDAFLFEPVEDLSESPIDESASQSENRVSSLPAVTSESEQLPVPALSPKPTGLTRSLADIVSRYSIQLAEEINAELRNKSSRDSIHSQEIDAAEFESVDESTVPAQSCEIPQSDERQGSDAQRQSPRVEQSTSIGVDVEVAKNSAIASDQTVLVDEQERQQGLAEIARDLVQLGVFKTSATVADTLATVANAPHRCQSPREGAPQHIENQYSILAQQKEAQSIAIVGESLGVKKSASPNDSSGTASSSEALSSEALSSEALSPDKRIIKAHKFDTARDLVVHDVPVLSETDLAESRRSPTPSLTPSPEDASSDVAGNGDTSGPQAAAPPEPPERNLVAVLGGRAKLDSRHWPLIGDTTAKHILVELFDYTCPHCRKMNQHIHEARQRYGSDFAVMALAVPLSRECNDTVDSTKARHQAACELARLAVAVWRVNPEAFEVFHNWLFEPEHGRTTGEAWAYATQLVGNQPLQEEMSKPVVSQFISKHVELYKRAGQGTVPKLMFPTVTIRGEMTSTDGLCDVIERELFNK